MTASEHKCKATGAWEPGAAKTCEKCKPVTKFQVGRFVRVSTGRL